MTTDKEPGMNLARSKDEWRAARKRVEERVTQWRDQTGEAMSWLRRRDEYER